MFSPIFPCPLDSLWAKIQDGRHFRGKLVVHTHFVEICMCDTCSIPFSGTGNSFPYTRSWLEAIWDHNWTFKHHLIAISRSFKVHPYMLDMIRMTSPVLNLFIWLLDYHVCQSMIVCNMGEITTHNHRTRILCLIYFVAHLGHPQEDCLSEPIKSNVGTRLTELWT